MKNNILGVLIGIIIGVILIGTLLAPTIEGIQKTAGDEVTLTNTTNIVLREVQPGDELICVSTWDSDANRDVNAWTLNDEPITTPAGTQAWNVGIMSDGVYLQITGLSDSSIGIWYDMAQVNPTANYLNGATASDTNRTATFLFTDEEISVVYTTSASTSTRTFGYTWGYIVCPYADGEYCAAVSGGTVIVSNADEIILCGAYTTGDNDTMYSYRNGVTYTSNSSYTMALDVETALHENTTDIYDATVSVDIGGETFTPYRILVPYEVTGHATSGAAYSMYGAIIILAIAALLIIGVRIITNRD